MSSVQNFEVVLRASVGMDEATLKDVGTIVNQAVKNSSLDMAMSTIKSKLIKEYGEKVSICSASSSYGRRMFFWIDCIKAKGLDAVLVDGIWRQVDMGVDIENLSMVEKRNLPAYRWGMVKVYVQVVESFNLLNLAMRKVMKMVKDKENIHTLEIPDEVKDLMNKYWSF